MLLELKNVCYTYNKDTSFSVNALENINLQIPEGQFVGVIGHTGSGKSTLIQHFNGLIRPTDGQVLYMGEDIWQEKYNLQALPVSGEPALRDRRAHRRHVRSEESEVISGGVP